MNDGLHPHKQHVFSLFSDFFQIHASSGDSPLVENNDADSDKDFFKKKKIVEITSIKKSNGLAALVKQ